MEAAIDDLIKMSVSSFENLKELDLFENKISEEMRLNRLFKLAMEKITAIPFLLTQEHWRWNIYSGNTSQDNLKTIHDLR